MPDNKLNARDVNEKIQPKSCKVITDYGEASGFLVDDEKGIVLSSFHLIGSVKPIKYPIIDFLSLKILCILSHNGYLDSNEFRLTPLALAVTSKEQIKLTLEEKKEISLGNRTTDNNSSLLISATEVLEIKNNSKILQDIKIAFQKNKVGDSYPIKTDLDLKIICILRANGYLDTNFCLTKKVLETQGETLNEILNQEYKFSLSDGSEYEINLEEILKIKTTPETLDQIIKIFQDNKDNTEYRYPINSISDLKAAYLLNLMGYLDQNWHLTPLAKSTQSKDELVKNFNKLSIYYQIQNLRFENLIVTVTPEESQTISTNTTLVEEIFNIFKQAHDVNDITILTETVEILFDNQRLIGKIYFPERKNNDLLKRNYAFFDTVPIQITHFEDGTPFSSNAKFIDTGEIIKPLLASMDPIEIGEKIYFRSYPLTQQEYTFSTGIISSIKTMSEKNVFVIEAPVAPGNSGSFVFIRRGNEVYWIGAISSEIASVSERIIQLRNSTVGKNNNIHISTGTSKISFTAVFIELIDTLLNNLSTGKGNVIVLKNVDCLFDEALAQQVNLFLNQFLDFFVPKKKIAPPKIKLFEFINNNHITRLSVNDLVKYINASADVETRRAIFSKINQSGIKGHIIFPKERLEKDKKSSEISRDDISSKYPQDMLALYNFAFMISQNQLQENQFQFTDENTPVQDGTYVTRKFYTDHIGGKNRKHQKKTADSTATRRTGISVSTTISESDLDAISEEVGKSQSFYETAKVKVQEAISNSGKTIKSTFFQTIGIFSLEVRTRTGSPERSTSTFFYSTAYKNNTHYLHHFAGTEKKEDWKELSVEQENPNSRKVYYKCI